MTQLCKHTEVRFLACSAADRFPGKWVCDCCNESFNFDPLGRTSVRYLDHPNPNATKEAIRFSELSLKHVADKD